MSRGPLCDERETVSRGFESGNYANAYISDSFRSAWADPQGRSEGVRADGLYRAAFVLGFFSGYELHEMSELHREEYTIAYTSRAGQLCLEAGYIDPIPELDALIHEAFEATAEGDES